MHYFLQKMSDIATLNNFHYYAIEKKRSCVMNTQKEKKYLNQPKSAF